MTWWSAPPGGRLVYVPTSLRGLPAYKRDACRAFVDGLSPRMIGGTTNEFHPCR